MKRNGLEKVIFLFENCDYFEVFQTLLIFDLRQLNVSNGDYNLISNDSDTTSVIRKSQSCLRVLNSP